ncbi:SDR family oxidoreductase [Vibrio penaeicida]|uniref:SDR family oxidoreductase n=1 Tax=Vibrio penaeicida TaxID=104609 RepID=UPI000CEA4106|nr:SDR family oxidoreductase [Vibrio penaeicida]
MDIRNSVVLITSAGSGLGSTLAVHFTSLGARVVVADTDSKALLDTVKRCRTLSDSIYYYPLPDHSSESIQSLFNYIDERFENGVDVLINNWPSMPLPRLFGSEQGEEFTHKLSSLASSLYGYGKASALRMRMHKKSGVIVNLTSHQQHNLPEGLENVSAMIVGFTQTWAKELDPFNIRVGGVIPTQFRAKDSANGDWAYVQDEMIRNTEYIVSNDYFNGRVMASEA